MGIAVSNTVEMHLGNRNRRDICIKENEGKMKEKSLGNKENGKGRDA